MFVHCLKIIELVCSNYFLFETIKWLQNLPDFAKREFENDEPIKSDETDVKCGHFAG